MRKALLLVVSLAFAAASTGNAQVVGVKGGVSFWTMTNSGSVPVFSYQTGFAGGIHVVLPSDPGSMLMFQPELLFVQQGSQASNPTGMHDLKLSYLRLTANLRLNVPVGGLRSYLIGGPYGAVRVQCNLSTVSLCDDVSRTDWGVDLGAGLNFKGRHAPFMEARYSWGLKELNSQVAGLGTKNRGALVFAG
jgi:hypothetical protein